MVTKRNTINTANVEIRDKFSTRLVCWKMLKNELKEWVIDGDDLLIKLVESAKMYLFKDMLYTKSAYSYLNACFQQW